MRRAMLAGVLGAVLLVAFGSMSAFAATAPDASVPAGASSASATAAETPTRASSAVAPSADTSKNATTPAPTQAAGVVQAAALATDIAVDEHPDAPQPPLVDNFGGPLLGTGFAATPDGAGAVTYGGLSISGGASSAASWLWDGTTWSEVCAVCGPGLRGLVGVATDLATAAPGVVMYGGSAAFGGAGLPDAWVFADGSWTQLCAVCSPGARFGPVMAGGGAAGDQVLLFGGASDGTGAPGTQFNDTWGFDGSTWTQLDAGVAGDPAPRFGASMAWDGTRFILFGGAALVPGGAVPITIDDGTWAWVGDHWTQLCANAAACGPAPRALAYSAALDSPDPSRRGVLLVGGLVGGDTPTVLGDIWFWHDGQWIQQVSPWLDEQPLFDPTGPFVVNGAVASLSALCEASVVGGTEAGTVSTFNLGLDTNGDGVIDPCPVVPPPTPTPTPENVVAPAAPTGGVAAEASAAGTLPFTGSVLAGPMTFATALLGVGLILVAASRRQSVSRRARSNGMD